MCRATCAERLLAPIAVVCALALAPAAQAATVSVQGGALQVRAGVGEANALTLASDGVQVSVTDASSPGALAAGAGCDLDSVAAAATCPAAGVTSVDVDAGDGSDQVDMLIPLPALLNGGLGDDALRSAGGADTLSGGPGFDSLQGGDGADTLDGAEDSDSLDGGAGDDILAGGDANDSVYGEAGNDAISGDAGDDRVLGDGGRDHVDGGAGDDRLEVRDRQSDSVLCGSGRDLARAEVLDALDFACERVDYGLPGSVGRLRPIRGGGRFVAIPGQFPARVDRRILPDVLYLIRRYHVRVGDGYALHGHKRHGEHPLGLAVDLYPGAGGSWRTVAKLAKWAEPRQNHPRWPFRWVGWNGDQNHGDPRHCRPARGCPPHLHLSWAHTPGRPGHPVRTVWIWQVRTHAP
jgi:hypothetical protein